MQLRRMPRKDRWHRPSGHDSSGLVSSGVSAGEGDNDGEQASHAEGTLVEVRRSHVVVAVEARDAAQFAELVRRAGPSAQQAQSRSQQGRL